MSDPRMDLYQKYKDAIYLYLYRSTMDRHIAEDLTQDTFMKGFQSLSSFRGEASLKTWLFKIARNTFINYIKKKQHSMEVNMDTSDRHFITQVDPYKLYDDQVLIEQVLLLLPENYRTYIILRDANGLTYEEMSAITNENIGQVKVGLYRARKKFKQVYLQKTEDEK